MKIIHININNPFSVYGGTENFLKNFIKFTNSIDHQNVVIYYNDRESKVSKEHLINHTRIYKCFFPSLFRWLSVPSSKIRSVILRLSMLINLTPCEFKCINDIVTMEKADIVYFHNIFGLPINYIINDIESLSIPMIQKVHDIFLVGLTYRGKKIPIWGNLVTKILNKYDLVIFVSRYLIEKAVQAGFKSKNYIIIPNGYDPEVFRPMDKDYMKNLLNVDSPLVGYVGRLSYEKGADRIPKIFYNIKKHIKKVKFIIIGNGYLKKEVEDQTKSLDIIFKDGLDHKEIARWMNAMDVMILPSRSEGWPCVVKEAQACGTVVVGSDSGGLPEAIGLRDFIVSEGENFEERFAKKVIEVLREGYDKRSIIKNAEAFTWEKIINKELKTIKKIIS